MPRIHPPRTAQPLWLVLVLVLAIAALATAGGARNAAARPPIRKAFFNVYPQAVGSRLDNLPSHATHCGVCHFDFNGGGPRNPYGRRVEAAGGNETGIQSIQAIDADGDGQTSLVEITDLVNWTNTPTFPGLKASGLGSVDSTSNVPNLSEITPYLTPSSGVDNQPPMVTVTAPNGGESWTGGTAHTIAWLATDNVGVNSVDVFYRESAAAPWQPLSLNGANSGTLNWFVRNTPTPTARVRVVARDAAGNSGADSSNANFTIVQTPGGIVPTTLRDFEMGGTQPLGGGTFQDVALCVTCHGGYDSGVEPGHNFLGSMMAQAARDPLFFACVAIAEQDAPSSGDLCIRCHSPRGWLGGRSTPTDGSQLTQGDRDGVSCDFCHRAVDPFYKPGISPGEDQAILSALLLPAHSPSNGQFVVDPEQRKRGPFSDTVAPHAVLTSPFHRTSEFCGTCHDVSNPVFTRLAGDDYAPGPLDQMADSVVSNQLMPLERTYSEWKNSAYPAGVYAPAFAGNRPDGMVASCQDCHLRDVSGKGCNDPTAATRPDLPLHDMTGGNAWMPPNIYTLYPAETDLGALSDAATRAAAMLARAASVDVAVTAEGDSFRADVTVTNHTGHKLPTGYPEGRRMWLEVVARDAEGQVVYHSGGYDAASASITPGPDLVTYEIHLGISPALASGIGLPAGESFHFALNDTIHKDNRIPPLGFSNAAFASFGGNPVDPTRPAPRYPDGQNWDVSAYRLPASARSVKATLHYQSTSAEYVTFLRDHNTTNSRGQELYDLWVANGKSPPLTMAADSTVFGPVDVADGRPPVVTALRALTNPFRGSLRLGLELARADRVRLEIYDARGRRVAGRDAGTLPAGSHVLSWSGETAAGHAARPGVYWARVEFASGAPALVRQVVRVE